MRMRILAAGAAFSAAAFGLVWAASAQTSEAAKAETSAAAAASKGVYSKAQADRGATAYAENCARCHGGGMEGLDVAPPLIGPRFLGNWTNQPVSELAKRIRTTMPLDMPGAIGTAASVEITADILAANGYPAGATELPTGSSELSAVMIDPPPTK